jgi:hypothetical protein
MNFDKACGLLDIDPKDDNWRESLKKQYKMKALKHHPDRSCNKKGEEYNDDAFKEISAAYQFLDEYMDFDSMKKDTFIGNLISVCEYQAAQIIQGLTCENFIALYNIVIKYRQYLHLSTAFHDIMEKRNIYWFSQGHLKKRHENEMTTSGNRIYNKDLLSSTKKYTTYCDPEWNMTYYVEKDDDDDDDEDDAVENQTFTLNPLLDDVMTENVYKLIFKEETYLIPLWHHELVYGKHNGDDDKEEELIVKVEPRLPSPNYWIDEDNNLHQKIEYNLCELWDCVSEDKCMEIYFGKKRLLFYPNRLKLQTEQTWEWKNQGISAINSCNVYDISKKADIILHIHISGIM